MSIIVNSECWEKAHGAKANGWVEVELILPPPSNKKMITQGTLAQVKSAIRSTVFRLGHHDAVVDIDSSAVARIRVC